MGGGLREERHPRGKVIDRRKAREGKDTSSGAFFFVFLESSPNADALGLRQRPESSTGYYFHVRVQVGRSRVECLWFHRPPEESQVNQTSITRAVVRSS